MRFEDKTAIVTGGASGIGKEVATRFVASVAANLVEQVFMALPLEGECRSSLLLCIFATAAAPQELGRVHFQTSCTPQARQKFDRGLAMVRSFVYPDSVAAFTELLQPILECAIAYRRIAISHRPLVALIFGFGVIVEEVQARDFGRYANSPAEQRKWFKDLAPPGRNPGTWSCCDQGDVVRTKFRVNKKSGDDEWMYLAADGTWKLVSPDIILWDKINDPMNDGQARLWVSPYLKEPDGTAKPICFIPPRSGN